MAHGSESFLNVFWLDMLNLYSFLWIFFCCWTSFLIVQWHLFCLMASRKSYEEKDSFPLKISKISQDTISKFKFLYQWGEIILGLLYFLFFNNDSSKNFIFFSLLPWNIYVKECVNCLFTFQREIIKWSTVYEPTRLNRALLITTGSLGEVFCYQVLWIDFEYFKRPLSSTLHSTPN